MAIPVNLPCDGTPVLSVGATLSVKDPDTGDKIFVGGVTSFDGPQMSRGEIDTTRLCSTAKESVPDLPDYGTFSSNIQTMFGNLGQKILVENFSTSTSAGAFVPLDFTLTIPDDGYGRGLCTVDFKGYVTAFPISGAVSQVVATALSIRITGQPVISTPDTTAAHVVINPTTLRESSANNGEITGSVQILVYGDTFAGTDGAVLPGATASGVPAGLSAVFTKLNASTAVLSFTGTAVDHDAGDSAAITFTLGNTAFTGGDASKIGGVTNRAISIVFTD